MKANITIFVEEAPAPLVKKSCRHLWIIADRLIAGLFENYQDWIVTKVKLDSLSAPNPTLQSGAAARVNGTLIYEDGFTSHFEAILEQSQKGEWQIAHLYTVVPPDKWSDHLTSS